MRKIFLLLSLYFVFCLNIIQAEVISGKVNHNDMKYQNKIVDSKTQKTISNAKISIPEMHYTTYSDENGAFQLNADISGQTVLFVEKEGYKVFSLTVDNNVTRGPLKLGIEQSGPFDLQITGGVVHLGDNMFSNNSANSSEFRLNADGHYLSRKFNKPSFSQGQDVILKIGTIIGLDTKKAKEMGQNRIAKVYSSPMEVFVNGKRIGVIELNGDNHEIIIPQNLLKASNELLIKTGRNLFQTEYVDYDDVELANVRVEVKEKEYYARH